MPVANARALNVLHTAPRGGPNEAGGGAGRCNAFDGFGAGMPRGPKHALNQCPGDLHTHNGLEEEGREMERGGLVSARVKGVVGMAYGHNEKEGIWWTSISSYCQ